MSNKPKPSTHRSPAYPSISLPQAIEKIRDFWRAYTKNIVPRTTALERWGYTVTTGPAARVIAALKQFGLISEEDKGIKLTERGRDLATLPKTDERYKNAANSALHSPTIYKKLLENYGEKLPDDSLLKAALERDHDFNPKSTPGFIKDFRASIAYIDNLSVENGSSDDGSQEESGKDTSQNTPHPKRPHSNRMTNFAFPLGSGDVVTISAPHPMADEDFEMLLATMKAAKRGFVGLGLKKSNPPESGE
jgi:hypothetical protein